MAGRISVCLMFAVVSGCFASAVAAPLGTAGDGCDNLRNVVLEQLRNYTQAVGGRTLLLADKGEPQIPEPPEYCMDAAAVTTAAFGAAMHAAGILVSWGAQSSRSGDYCLSHHLEECYPRGEFGGPATANQLSFVHDAWRAVSKSVRAAMPYGVESDIAVFELTPLATSMEQRLRGEWRAPNGKNKGSNRNSRD